MKPALFFAAFAVVLLLTGPACAGEALSASDAREAFQFEQKAGQRLKAVPQDEERQARYERREKQREAQKKMRREEQKKRRDARRQGNDDEAAGRERENSDRAAMERRKRREERGAERDRQADDRRAQREQRAKARAQDGNGASQLPCVSGTPCAGLHVRRLKSGSYLPGGNQ